LLPEVVPDEALPVEVETGAAGEMTVERVVGAAAAATTGAWVVVGCSTATGVVEVGAGAGVVEVGVSWMKAAGDSEVAEEVAGAGAGMEVLEAAVDAGTRTGVPSTVIVPMGTGTPVR
jgi:hypothetical protein